MIKCFGQHLLPVPMWSSSNPWEQNILLVFFCLFWGGGVCKKKNKKNNNKTKKKKKKIPVCCQRVRPLPLQPRPVHNAMSIDRLHTQQVYIGWGGVGWVGVVVSLSWSLTCHCFSTSPKDMQKNKKKFVAFCTSSYVDLKIRTIAISM